MGNSNHQLEIRTIGQITGRFRIPSYQRGYRWERRQVEQLLDDLLEAFRNDPNKPYYLQPIVVAPASHEELEKLPDDEKFDYDLIDGQQRLTTILLIFKALESLQTTNLLNANFGSTNDSSEEEQKILLTKIAIYSSLQGANTKVNYELMYQTRKQSRSFINGITGAKKGDPLIIVAPDHLYMWHAFNTVTNWIYTHANDVRNIVDAMNNNIRLIWYELAESVPNWKKFKDLNDGKIPLTNSELIKALILHRNNRQELPDYEQDVIVSQWDAIEQDLSDIRFWRFLTKKPMSDYQTKIDLLFDLISGKSEQNKKDEFYTFRWFSDKFDELKDEHKDEHKKDGKTSKERWVYIHDRYRRIRDWYNNTSMYHRLGYLVAVGDDSTLREIYLTAYPDDKDSPDLKQKEPLDHKQFIEEIECRIKETLNLSSPDDIKKLRYGQDNNQIIKVLTLYNVMLADELKSRGVRYPFHVHNADLQGGWSLEHVHAQNSDELKGQTEWRTWVKDQLQSLQRIEPQLQTNGSNYTKARFDSLVNLMQSFLKSNRVDAQQYKDIVTEFSEVTSIKGSNVSKYDMHSIANLALLSRNDNSMLNKSTFDVKRMKIALRSSTNFVPLGTERVFMKAIVGCEKGSDGKPIGGTEYSCETSQMFFWSDTDRDAYMKDIKVKLAKYLPTTDQTPDGTAIE